MESIEQINEDFNVKKPKKKGLIIGVIIAIAIVIALLIVYFLLISKPQYIFNRTIDKIFKVNSQNYDSVKLESKAKVSLEAEDSSIEEQLKEIEKYALKFGTQMDVKNKKEIVDLGLEYDNNQVIDAQVYVDNDALYSYFEGLFDKYIKIDINEEQKAAIEDIFANASEKQSEDSNKAINILKDELKKQIQEEGKFESEKTTIDIGDEEEKVTKTTLILSQKELYNVISNICSNLAENDEFIDCFEESPKELLNDLKNKINSKGTYDNNSIEIALYTKGLLNNLVGIDLKIKSEDTTIVCTVIKEDKDVYAYNVSVKKDSQKIDVIKGKIEIEKDEDSNKEQSGKAKVTLKIPEVATLKLSLDYSIEYNNGIDKLDVSNSVNMTDLTEQDIEKIREKLLDRPVIGDLIKNIGTTDVITNGEDNIGTSKNLTTSQNEVKDDNYGYSVTYSVPTGFKYEDNYSYDYSKYYSLGDYSSESQINANVSMKLIVMK